MTSKPILKEEFNDNAPSDEDVDSNDSGWNSTVFS